MVEALEGRRLLSGSLTGISITPNCVTYPPDLVVTKTADSSTVTAGQTIGFTITVSNTGGSTANDVVLTDLLPAGKGGDIFWTIVGGDTSAFQITGPLGNQMLVLTSNTLDPGVTETVHITSPTNAADATASTGNSFDTTGTAAAGIITLGSASNYAVLGLTNAKIINSLVTINGNEGVAQGGKISNNAPSKINGNVYEYSSNQYSGPGKLSGSVITNSSLLNQNVADALNASAVAKSLTPDFTLGSVTTSKTLTATAATRLDGVTVVNINGNIQLNNGSLTLSGTATDVFVVNVTGNASFVGTGGLNLAGGLTANHVLYNFTGSSGTIQSHVGNVFYGTLLGANYNFDLDGKFYGEIIGGKTITMKSGAQVNSPSQVTMLTNMVTVTACNVEPDCDDTASAIITLLA